MPMPPVNTTVKPSASALSVPAGQASLNNVLIAEDDAMFRRILQSWLSGWGFQTQFASDGEQAWQMLQQEQAPQLLILDWMMPGVDGLQLCRRIRRQQDAIYRYILLVTSRDDKGDMVGGLDAGADDYLTKPFDKSELRARLAVGSRILALQRDLIAAREELRFQANHDPLTSAWNRGALLQIFQRELQRGARENSSTALLILDADHFKTVNDTHGHLAGDQVLKELVSRISGAVRPYDIVGRYGGEEFLVILPKCSAENALETAERIRVAVASRPFQIEGAAIELTVSVGATAAQSGITREIDLLATADAALYNAKAAGRNCVVVG